MSVEVLIQNINLGNKDAIIQSLTRLINLLNKDPKMQEEVIQCLPEEHILLIIDCLEHSDPTLRKLAAKFLLDLVHDNYLVQLVFCDILGLIPCDGKVCINSIPEAFKNVSRHIPECLEALRSASAEETQGPLPYCWYLHIQDAEKSDKNVVFIPNEDKDMVVENNAFFDPHFSMLGFVMRGPRKENNEKPKSRVSDVVRPASSYHPTASLELGNSAVSVDNNMFQRTQPDMKSSQTKTVTASNLKSATTNKRKTLIKNPIVTGSTQVSTRTMKATMINSSVLTPTNYFPKTEKSQNNRTTVMSTEAIDDTRAHTTEKETRSKPNSAKKEPSGGRLGVRKTEPTIEPLERFQESKLNASINEMSETQSHEIDGSLRNSQVFAAHPHPQENMKGKSKTVKVIKTPKGLPEKTLSYRDKNTSSMLTTDELNSSQLAKNKISDIDKRLQLKTPKGNPAASPSNPSTKSATNTNLLNKILKSKPQANDKQMSATQSSQKQGIDKASFWDFIYAYRKLNATALSSVMTSSTKATKSPITTNYPKKEDLSKTLMSESNLPSKKKATHTSLIQSGELVKSSLKEKYEALDEELSLDVAQPTPKETVYSSRKSNLASAPLKNYHISAGFKNPIASSRVSQEIKKENLTSFGKLLSPRRSHDVTYLANHKKKVDASTTIQSQKNNKKVATKKVNQTMAADSPRIK